MADLLVTVGLPGSGKSSWSAGHGVPVVTLDEFRTVAAAGAKSDRWLIPNARRELAASLATGDAIVDGCNLQPATRSGWIGLADAMGARPVAVVFDTDPTVCRERDLLRGADALPDYRWSMVLKAWADTLARLANEPWADVRFMRPAAPSRSW